MMKNTSLTILALVALLGCKDKTAEEYKTEQWQKNLARYDSVSGNYRGIVVSKNDGSVLGAMELTLRADTKVTPGNNGDNTNATPILVGNVRFLDRTIVDLVAPDGFYDPDTGAYHSEISISRGASTEPATVVTLGLNGSIHGNVVAGEIQTANYPNYGGRFQLVKDGDSLDSLLRSARPNRPTTPDPSESLTLKYPGSGVIGGETRKDLELSVTDPGVTLAEAFLDLFIPQPEKIMIVSLRFSEDVYANFTTRWDTASGQISGSYVSSNGSYRAELQCRGFFFTKTTRAFNCQYWTNRTPRISMTFQPNGHE